MKKETKKSGLASEMMRKGTITLCKRCGHYLHSNATIPYQEYPGVDKCFCAYKEGYLREDWAIKRRREAGWVVA